MLDWLENLGAWMAQSPRAWLAAGLGAAALALLARRRPNRLATAGLVAAVFAAAVEWSWRAGGDASMLAKALAALFAGVAVAAGGGLAAGRQPVYAALSFAVAVLGAAGLFLLQGASFLAAASVVVYAGAIIVTFVFAIMLASTDRLAAYDAVPWNPIAAAVGAALFAGAALSLVERNFRPSAGALLAQRLIRFDVELAERPPASEPRIDGVALDEALRRLWREGPSTPNSVRFGKELAKVSARWRASWGLPPRPDSWLNQGVAEGDPSPAATAPEGSGVQLVALRELHSLASAISEAQRAAGAGPAQLTPAAKEFVAWREHRSPLSVPGAGERGTLPALGRALWGDYLMGVEIAGTLLLLAAIGAIAVNQSPREAA